MSKKKNKHMRPTSVQAPDTRKRETVELKTITKHVSALKIVYPQEVYDKIMHWVSKSKLEVSGFCRIQPEGNTLRVLDAYLLDEGDSAETTISPAKVMELDERLENMPGMLKLWWHSHVNMPVFWSGTDQAAMSQLSEHGWFAYTVFNKAYEYNSAVGLNQPFKMILDGITTSIERVLSVELTSAWDAEYTANKKPEPVAMPYDRGYPYLGQYSGVDLMAKKEQRDCNHVLYDSMMTWELAEEHRDLLAFGHTETDIKALLGPRAYHRAKSGMYSLDVHHGV